MKPRLLRAQMGDGSLLPGPDILGVGSPRSAGQGAQEGVSPQQPWALGGQPSETDPSRAAISLRLGRLGTGTSLVRVAR